VPHSTRTTTVVVARSGRPVYPVVVTTDQNTERRSWLTRFAFDADGQLRGWRLLAIAAAGAMALSLGTTVAIVLTGTGTPEAMPAWVVIAFVAIKLPLLALLWWLLGRRRPQDADLMSAEQAGEALTRLRRAAQGATRYDDAWDRLDGLAAEARFVATHSPPEVAGEAAQLADELAERRDARRPVSAST